MGCFTDQVKWTRALVQNLDEAIKEIKLLGEHEEESSRKITELETLCKKLRDDTQRLEEEKPTLEGMVESCDELLMEIARETGLDCMGEERMLTMEEMPPHPLPLHHHLRRPLLPCLKRSMKRALWRQSQSKKFRCRMRSSWQRLSLRYHNSVSTVHS
jgi:DNA repair exonuclease SbcCD ATPase subunit